MKRTKVLAITCLIGALLSSSCGVPRECPSLKVLSLQGNHSFGEFLKSNPHISQAYKLGKEHGRPKSNDLSKIDQEDALDQAETASITLIRSLRDPFKLWYNVRVSISTRDGFTVAYSELMEPAEYDYFCASGTFVISSRGLGKKPISVNGKR